jgi:hypothetical protein
MPNVDRSMFPDEPPTRPEAHVPEVMVFFATRIDRLTRAALERLQCAPDDDALADVVSNLLEVRVLTAAVLR